MSPPTTTRRCSTIRSASTSAEIGRAPGFRLRRDFCLGAVLARMEVNSFFSELFLPVKSIEGDGEPELIATTFVGGLKHLPIRYSLR